MTPAQHRERAEALLDDAQRLGVHTQARANVLAEATLHALLSQPAPAPRRSRKPASAEE